MGFNFKKVTRLKRDQQVVSNWIIKIFKCFAMLSTEICP